MLIIKTKKPKIILTKSPLPKLEYRQNHSTLKMIRTKSNFVYVVLNFETQVSMQLQHEYLELNLKSLIAALDIITNWLKRSYLLPIFGLHVNNYDLNTNNIC